VLVLRSPCIQICELLFEHLIVAPQDWEPTPWKKLLRLHVAIGATLHIARSRMSRLVPGKSDFKTSVDIIGDGVEVHSFEASNEVHEDSLVLRRA
jgi:hypothetical protein